MILAPLLGVCLHLLSKLMPHGLKTKLVDAFTTQTTGLKRSLNRFRGRLIQSDTLSARWMEKYLGACSPKTRWA